MPRSRRAPPGRRRSQEVRHRWRRMSSGQRDVVAAVWRITLTNDSATRARGRARLSRSQSVRTRTSRRTSPRTLRGPAFEWRPLSAPRGRRAARLRARRRPPPNHDDSATNFKRLCTRAGALRNAADAEPGELRRRDRSGARRRRGVNPVHAVLHPARIAGGEGDLTRINVPKQTRKHGMRMLRLRMSGYGCRREFGPAVYSLLSTAWGK